MSQTYNILIHRYMVVRWCRWSKWYFIQWCYIKTTITKKNKKIINENKQTKNGHETCETRYLKTGYVERIMEAAPKSASKLLGV